MFDSDLTSPGSSSCAMVSVTQTHTSQDCIFPKKTKEEFLICVELPIFSDQAPFFSTESRTTEELSHIKGLKSHGHVSSATCMHSQSIYNSKCENKMEKCLQKMRLSKGFTRHEAEKISPAANRCTLHITWLLRIYQRPQAVHGQNFKLFFNQTNLASTPKT